MTRRDREARAVLEADRRSVGRGGAAVELDAEAACGARRGADQAVAVLHPPADARVDRLAHQPGGDEEGEDVAPEDALGQRHLAGADGEVDLVGAGELLGDLEAGVAAADHEHGPGRDGVGRAVGRAVELDDVAAQPLSDLRHARHLEGAGGDHDLVGPVRAVVELDDVAVAVAAHGLDAAVVLDRQREVARVLGEVGDDLVAGGVVVRVAREGEPGEAVVADGSEQPERLPAAAPRRGGAVGGLEDGEPPALLGEVVADGEAGLAARRSR